MKADILINNEVQSGSQEVSMTGQVTPDARRWQRFLSKMTTQKFATSAIRHDRLRFRLRTVLILMAVMALLIASGVKSRCVGAVYEATSMPGAPGFEIPIYQKGWLVGLFDQLASPSNPHANTFKPTTKRTER